MALEKSSAIRNMEEETRVDIVTKEILLIKEGALLEAAPHRLTMNGPTCQVLEVDRPGADTDGISFVILLIFVVD